MTLLAAHSAPGTSLVTTAETLAANIPPTSVAEPPTTALVDVAEPADAGASGTFDAPFEFIDAAGLVNLAQGYSLTVVQTGAGTNGTITEVNYDVDTVIP